MTIMKQNGVPAIKNIHGEIATKEDGHIQCKPHGHGDIHLLMSQVCERGNMTDRGDWTYATLEGSDVTVKSGATFQLSHHALMTGNVNVEEGGSFVINQTVNAASESIGGSLRQDMVQLGITSL